MNSNERLFDHHQAPENNSATKTSEEKEKTHNMNSLVTLDLAGQFDIHLSSPSVVVAESGSNYDLDSYRRNIEAEHLDNAKFATTPLFRWGKTVLRQNTGRRGTGGVKCLLPFPHVHVGGKYNFKTVWYGLTRLGLGMSWGAGATTNYRNQQRRGQPSLSANISAEKGLLSPNDYSLDVGLAFPMTKTLFQDDSISTSVQQQFPTSIGLRYETMNSNHQNQMTATVTAKTSFLHPRVQIVGRSIMKLRDSTLLSAFSNLAQSSSASASIPLSSSPFLSRIQQRKLQLSDELSWMPDIKMTPGGKVISNSSFGLCPINKRGGNSGNINDINTSKNRMGIRLTVKKQINWNILGSIFQHQQQQQHMASMSYDNDDEGEGYNNNDTAVRLEVCGVTGVKSYTSFAVEAALERLQETARCTFKQESVIN